MSKKNRKVDSKEVGLEIGLLLFKYFLNTEYLHYGLFNNGLATEVQNLAKAQQNYADFLIQHIPSQVKTILDVGCGSGRFAKELSDRGYQVDCVSPGTILTDHARTLLAGRSEIFNCKYEDLKTDKKYDMVLFSESFQYIDMDASFSNSLKYLNPQGHIMVCDFFKTDPENKSMLGGGHDFQRFLEVQKKYPVSILKEQDITKETAPTIDLVNKLSMEVLHPIYKLLFLLLEDRFAWVAKFIRWKYQKKLDKMERKHFQGQRNGANFQQYKKYMFYLYQAK
ncbi:MAG: class I SAM-dependent methyltransferase [Cytophagaceae bacterium]|jgi:2-polyprenyl-3-methyl-5-hydroxy-6-metoxy-1,4-benzoquinol methylase|nr:class I SAM-dependent methyltransferase [Cytophagaceae bacterium]